MNKARSNFNDIRLEGCLTSSCLVVWCCRELCWYSYENLPDRCTHLLTRIQHRWKTWSFLKDFFHCLNSQLPRASTCTAHHQWDCIKNYILLGWVFRSTLAPVGSSSAPALTHLAYVGCCTTGTYWNLVVARDPFQYVPGMKYLHNTRMMLLQTL